MVIPEMYRREVKGKTTRKVRRTVRKVQRGFGHPSKEVFLMMLRLANASGAAIAYAKVWGVSSLCCVTDAVRAPYSYGNSTSLRAQ